MPGDTGIHLRTSVPPPTPHLDNHNTSYSVQRTWVTRVMICSIIENLTSLQFRHLWRSERSVICMEGYISQFTAAKLPSLVDRTPHPVDKRQDLKFRR